MASILTSAQHVATTGSGSTPRSGLDSASGKDGKVMFDKAYSDRFTADERRKSEGDVTVSPNRQDQEDLTALPELSDPLGNAMPMDGRHLPLNDNPLGAVNPVIKLTESNRSELLGLFDGKLTHSAHQSFNALTPSSAVPFDLLASSSGLKSPLLDNGFASPLLNVNTSIDLNDSVMNINTRLIPSIELRSSAASHQHSSTSGTLANASMSLPGHHPQWGMQFQQRLSWLVGKNVSSAEIHLNPPELGALQVKIDQRQDSTVVTITSHNASTRDLMESNAYRLKELFSEQGLELLDVEVNDGQEQDTSAEQQFSGEMAFAETDSENHSSTANGAGATVEVIHDNTMFLRYGVVDTFV